MSVTRGGQLIDKFLGPDATRGGPFGLLGIDPGTCTPSGVEAALERQLDRIAQHPDAESPAADAVRLALDNAARELLDPVMRAQWIAEYRRAEAAPAAEPVRAAPRLDPAPAVPAPSATLAASTGDRPPRIAPAVDIPVRRTRTIEGDPLVKRLLMFGGIGFGLMLLALAVGVWLLSPGGPASVNAPPGGSSSQGPPAPIAAASAQPDASTVQSPPAPPPLAPLRQRGRSEFVDGQTALRNLRTAASEFKTEPDRALALFEHAYATVADWWCRYDIGETRAAADAVVECIYQISSRPDHLDKFLTIIVEPTAVFDSEDRPISADEIWPAAWSAGVLARINRERDLPPQTTARLAAAMTRSLGAARPAGELSLENGVDLAMRALPTLIFANKAPAAELNDAAAKLPLEALKRWVEGVTLMCGADLDRRERFLAEALGWILTRDQDSAADARSFAAVSLLASEIAWRAGGPARARLMEWFRDPRVSDQEMRNLTSAIATRSSAEGVDQSMVLSMSATADDRVQLRGRYAAAWGIAEASARAENARAWVDRARAAVDHDPGADELSQLASAADLAELSREAFKLWRGEPGAGVFTASAPPPNPNAITLTLDSNAGLGAVTGQAADGAWAERYLAAERNIPVRLERLSELEQMGPPIGWIDAGVLAEAACFSSPVQVRAAAQRVVARLVDQPAMVSAMLDLVSSAPRTRNVSETYARVAVASLPRPTDSEWELQTRRALVERLLAMIADQGIHGEIEQLANRIAAAYLDAAGESAALGSIDAAAAGARRGAELLSEQARREAEGLPITRASRLDFDQIRRRCDQRRAQAIGPVQAFSAEETNLAEITGYLVAAERPEREARAVAILDDLATERRKARHVFGQVWAAERAIVRLWLLRLAEDQEGGS